MSTPRQGLRNRAAAQAGAGRWSLAMLSTAAAPAWASLLLTGGCATSADQVVEVRDDEASLTAEQRLQRLVEAEKPGAPVSGEIPVPPGVEQAILVADESDEAANLPLSEVLPKLASEVRLPSPVTEREEIEPQARDNALKHYVRGRDALLMERYLVAVTELERALAFDQGSAAILRTLAQSYGELDNASRMAGAYEQLLAYHPDDREALLRLALLAANQRDFTTAAGLLARRQLAEGDAEPDLIADHTLHVALRQLGYDFAAVQAAAPVLEAEFPFEAGDRLPQRAAAVFRQRAEVQRSIGDASCRLGRYGQALEAYLAALELPVADPGALQARIIYVNLKLGRPHAAQAALLSALKAAAPDLSDREIRLCEYVAAHTEAHSALADSVVELYGSHPDEPDLARAAALLLPPADASRLLQSFVSRRPRDVEVVGQLLNWLSARDEEAAVALIAGLIGEQPDLAEAYVQRLVLASPRPADLVGASREPEGPAYAHISSRVLAQLWSLGDAWFECIEALDRWPDDVGLQLLRIELAGQLDEPPLLEEAMEQGIELTGPWAWIVRARAWRSIDAFPEAIAAAESALEQSEGQPLYRGQALLELARAHAEQAEPMPIDEHRNVMLQQAADHAEAARAADPSLEDAYELLLGLYTSNAQLFGRNAARSLLSEMVQAEENERLRRWLAAQQAIRSGEFEQGLEHCLNLYEGDATNVRSLALAMLTWERLERTAEAERWLRDKLAQRPGDPGLLDQFVRLLLRTEQIPEARTLLTDRLADDPDDPAALHLLELVYTAAGQFQEAVKLGEQRLARRPQGSRRALQEAAMYARAGKSAKAVDQLEWIRDHADLASYRHLVMAVALTTQLPRTSDRANAAAASLVEEMVERFPNVPLSVYGTALRSLARLGTTGGRFEALVQRAATTAREAQDTGMAGVQAWCSIAQSLVDEDEAAAAGRLLRARLFASPELDPPALGVMASAILAADAAADRVTETIDLLLSLKERSSLIHLRSADPTQSLPDALFWASQVYTLAGNQQGTEKLLQEAVRHDPDHAMAMNNLGYLRIEAGHDDEQTAEWIKRAYELVPDDLNVLDSLAWLRYKQGRFHDNGQAEAQTPRETVSEEGPGAVTLLQRIVRIDKEPSPEVLDHYGDALWRVGRHEQAIEQWRRAAGVLSDPAWREMFLRSYLGLQSERWGLVVEDPREMYDRDFGQVLRRIQSKIAEAEQGGAPAIAPTFQEMQTADTSQRAAEKAAGAR